MLALPFPGSEKEKKNNWLEKKQSKTHFVRHLGDTQ